ncbi:MAG: biotin attachment protein [Deinococcus sp.]|nr:biotin attachment protein [Deinococcus sp.]
MAVTVTLPKWGLTMEEGTIERWLRQVGDQVTKGEIIAEVVTDKISMELPAPASGRLVEILVPEGNTVQVGTPLAQIAEENR